MSVLFDKPKFINIVQYFLNNYCDMEAQVKALNDPLKNLLDGAKKTMRQDLIKNEDGHKSDFNRNAVSEHRKPGLPEYLSRPMRVYIADMIPNVMISDGHNLIEAVFTKESIYDFRKNYSHYKFSSLKDKVIFLTKWSLSVEKVDSKMIFNSYNNLTIKIIVESFKPISHEHLTNNIHRHSPNVQSVFRDEKIQNLVRCFRHWFSQQLVRQKCFSPLDVQAYDQSKMQVQDQIKMPSLKEVFLTPSMISSKDKNAQLKDPENVGQKIAGTQVFRLNNSTEDFINHKDLKADSYEDMHQFDSEISKRHALQLKDMKVYNVTQLIIQEQGERFYSEQRDRKILKEMERIEDQYYREQLKNKLEYFQIGNQNEELQDFKHFEYLWQRDEQEKVDKKDKYHCQRKVIAYTFNFPIEKTRHQVVRMLNRGRYESEKKMQGLGPSPHKTGRPRANSQENILQLNEEGSHKSNLLDNGPGYSREPLSQFVCHKMKEINSDTQSEDSMGAEIQKQMLNEKNNLTNPPAKGREPEDEFTLKLNEITNLVQPMQISLYQQYLDWFTDHELIRIKPQEISSQDNKGKESARPLESENTTKAESTVKHVIQDSPRFNIEMEEEEEENQPEDVQSENEEMTQSIRDSVNEDSEDIPDIVPHVMDKPSEKDVKVNAEESSKEEVVQQQIQDINMEISQEEQKFMNNLTIQPSPSEPSAVSSQNDLYNIKHEQPSSHNLNHGLGPIKQEETAIQKNENHMEDYGELFQKLQMSTATNDVSTMEETMMNLQKVMVELQQRKLKIQLEKERQRREQEELRLKEEAERKRKEEEEKERKRKEEEERKRRLEEEERLRKLEEERRERERIEKERQERLERERLERERIEKERLERERLEQERLQREEKERQEQERHQAEQRRLENERQAKLQQQELAKKQEEQRQRQIQMQVERQKRMVAERQRQERLKREQEERIQKEQEQQIELEILKYEAMIKQAEESGRNEQMQGASVVEDQEADWHDADADQEKPQSETLSSKESYHKDQENYEDIIPQETKEIFSAKKQYVQNMQQSLGSQIEKEIRQRAVKDLANRNFKSDKNKDRDIDMSFVCDQLKFSDKIQGIKIGDKLVPPASLQKKKTTQPLEEQEDVPLDNRYIMSSQEQEMEHESEQQDTKEPATSQQYQTQNDQIIIVSSETEKDGDDVQVITAREMKKQFQHQKEHALSQQYSQINEGALNQKVDQLTQLVAKLVNVISSQNAIKTLSQSDEEYHVPVFGSQPRDQNNPQSMAVNQLLTEVQPFLSSINQQSNPVNQIEQPAKSRQDLKRTYTQMEQQNSAQMGTPTADDNRPPNYSNLAQWCDEQRMVMHKKEIKTQYQERQRARSSSPMRQTNFNKSNGQQLINDKDRSNMNAQIKRDDRMNVQKQYQQSRPMQVVNRNQVHYSQPGNQQMRGGMNMTANKRYIVPSTQNPQQVKQVVNLHQQVQQHTDQAKRQRRSEEY